MGLQEAFIPILAGAVDSQPLCSWEKSDKGLQLFFFFLSTFPKLIIL